MKKFISIAALGIMIVIGCNSQQTPEAEIKKDEKVEAAPIVQNDKPVNLNKTLFLERIVDYEKNPGQWNYKGELPGVINFYADWCRPCRITSPILEELALEYSGKIQFYKVDVQAEQELASIFGIQAIPSFLFIPKNAQPVMSSGIAATPEMTKEMFRQQINEILLK